MHLSQVALLGSFVAGATAAASYTSLRDAAMNIDRGGEPFYIGAATYPSCYTNYNCSQTMRSEVNMLVAENDCKFFATQSSPTAFTLNACDKAMQVAHANNQAFRGHVLLWKDVNYSPWLADLDATTLRQVMVDHITKVMTHFKGKVPAWDVVNEAVSDDSPRTGPIMRDDWIWAKTGDDWIDVAFRTAHAVDPDAKLFYNDYNIENTNDKAEAVYFFVKDLVDRGIPIHGVGMQFHVQTNWYPSAERLGELLDRYAALGLDVHITELDIKCIAPCDPVLQGRAAKTIAETCLSRPNCKALLTWGISDGYTWLEPDTLPLPFDKEWKPKPFYTQLLAALNAVATPGGPTNGLPPLPVPVQGAPTAAGPNDTVITKGSGLETGWQNWSWGTTVDFAYVGTPAPPVGNSVIKAESTNFGGLSLRGSVFEVPGFESIHFRLAASTATPQLTLRVESTVENNYVTPEIPINEVCKAQFAVNEFQACSISLAQFGAHKFDRVSFMSKTGAAQTIYLADLFVKKTPPPPPTAGPNDIVVAKGNGLESGWENWSWGTTLDAAFVGVPAAPAGFGSSVVKAESTNYGGLSLKGLTFATPGYDSIHFRLAANTADPKLTFRIESTIENDYKTAEIPIAEVCKAPFVANQFQACSISLAPFGSHKFNRFSFMSKTAQAQQIFLADFWIKKTPAAAPVEVPATTVTATVTATSTVSATVTSVQTQYEVLTQTVTVERTTTAIEVFTNTLTQTQTVTATATVTPPGEVCLKSCQKAGPGDSCGSGYKCKNLNGGSFCVVN